MRIMHEGGLVPGFGEGPKIIKCEWEDWCRGQSHTTIYSLKLQCSCVCYPPAKWCHLPRVVFIIEILKAYSVAMAIYHHIKQVLVCVRPGDSLFPRLEEIRKNEGLRVLMKASESHGGAFFLPLDDMLRLT